MEFNPGDIITFRLRGDTFGIAHLIYIESLSQYDNYHVAILDAVTDAGEGGPDMYGDMVARTHDNLPDVGALPVVIDHLALTLNGFSESEPMIVGRRDITEEDLLGYHTWVLVIRREAERRGMIGRGKRDAEEENDAGTDDNGGESPAEDPGDAEDQAADGADETDEREITVKQWHLSVYDIPAGRAVFQFYGTLTEDDRTKDSNLVRFMATYFDPAANAERINGLVARLAGGDYSASTELMDYGDVAVRALGSRLADPMPEAAADILQVLGDMGGEQAYQIIADFFEKHQDLENDPLGLTAANGYCFAVMVTGGTPDALRAHLGKLEALLPYSGDLPDLQSAIESVRAAAGGEQTETPPGPGETSSAPFGNL